MENIYFDFNNQSKSKQRVTVGILFILLGIVTIFILLDKDRIGSIGIIIPMLCLIVGLIHIYEGLGSKTKDKLGKRFLKITEKEIVFKYDYFGKALELEWGNIKAVLIRYASLEFTKANNTIEKISIARLDYKQIKELKEYVQTIARALNIEEKEVIT